MSGVELAVVFVVAAAAAGVLLVLGFWMAMWANASGTVDRLVKDAKSERDDDLMDLVEALSTDDPDNDEPDDLAEHFVRWEADLASEPGIRTHMRRMDRWSA